MDSRYFTIRSLKAGCSLPSNLKMISLLSYGWIEAVFDSDGGAGIFKSQLSEGFLGICPGLFPQYLTRAMLEGQLHPTMPCEAGIECLYRMSVCFFINQFLIAERI